MDSTNEQVLYRPAGRRLKFELQALDMKNISLGNTQNDEGQNLS